jgi:hypothetical protein
VPVALLPTTARTRPCSCGGRSSLSQSSHHPQAAARRSEQCGVLCLLSPQIRQQQRWLLFGDSGRIRSKEFPASSLCRSDISRASAASQRRRSWALWLFSDLPAVALAQRATSALSCLPNLLLGVNAGSSIACRTKLGPFVTPDFTRKIECISRVRQDQFIHT